MKDDSLDFLIKDRPLTTEFSKNTQEDLTNLINFIKSILYKLKNNSKKELSQTLTNIQQTLNNIPTFIKYLYYKKYNASPRHQAAKEIEKILCSLEDSPFNDNESFTNIFLLYMEFIVEDAWLDGLSRAAKIIEQLEKKNNISFSIEIFALSKKIIEVSKLMICLKVERYELSLIFSSMRDKKDYTDHLYSLLFKWIVHTKKLHDEYLSRNSRENSYQYSSDFSKFIGSLYFSSLQEDDSKIWDLANYYSIFFDIIHFERKNNDGINFILGFYKNSDFKTQRAISYELVSQPMIEELIEKIKTLFLFKDASIEKQLLYSEIYFTGGQNIEWANCCQNKGYLIIRHSTHWVGLYDTQTGYLRNETGILFDAELLDSTKKNLTFKVLKRDGWHFYESSRGLRPESWDEIQLLTTSIEYRNYTGYFVGIKDKIFYLFKSDQTRPIKIFDKLRVKEILFFTHGPSPFFLVKIKNSYQLFDLENDQLIDKFPSNVESVELIENSDCYMILTHSNKKRSIYYLGDKTWLSFIGSKENCFQSFSTDLVVKNADESSYIIQNGKDIRNLTKEEFGGLARYELADRRSLGHFKSTGILRTSTVIRFDFQMELQGCYHITAELGKNHLWLYNFVGGGRSVSLYKNADQITCLGIAGDPHSDRKVFFLIEQQNALSLYVSYYDRLKALSDKKHTLAPNEVPYEVIRPEGQKITFLYDHYFVISKNGILTIYEYRFGFHAIQALEIKTLDYKNFLKLKLGDLWYLYDLSERSLIDIKGANAIQLSAENKIVFLYENYIQYLTYETLPKCAPVSLLEKTIKSMELVEPLANNYLVNFTKFPEYSFVNLENHDQSLIQMLMQYLDHQFLKKCTPAFYHALHELFEGKLFKLPNIDQLDLLLNVTNAAERNVIPILRALNKSLLEETSRVLSSFSLHKDLTHCIGSIQSELLVRTTTLSKKFDEYDYITKEITKLNKQIENLPSHFSDEITRLKKQEKENFLNMLPKHPHLLAEILRYWFYTYPDDTKINSLYQALKALSALEQRGVNNPEVCNFIIKNHALCLIKLYYFNPTFINNYVLSELWSIDPSKLHNLTPLQELFALFDSLKYNSQEKEIFDIFCKKAPGLQPIYEDLDDDNAQRIEESRYKIYLHILKLLAITNEIGITNIDSINFKSCKNHDEIIALLTGRLWSSFCNSLGISLNENSEVPFDIKFLINLFNASETLKEDDRTLFIVMLKAAIYQIDIKILFFNPSSLDIKIKFSNCENQLLSKLQIHNQKVENNFVQNKLNWNIWQKGLERVEGSNIVVQSWGRNVEHDLFQGEFCNSCISLLKSNARANLYYLSDFNFSMIEILDKKTNQSIGHVTIWIACNEKNEPVLAMNSFQFHSKFKKHSREIRDLVFKYASQLAFSLKVEHIILAESSQDDAPLSVLWELLSGIFEDKQNITANSTLSSRTCNEKNSVMEIENQTFSIIHPLFSEEMYSDIYFDGWVTTEDTYLEKPTVFNISLFLKQLSLFQMHYPHFLIEKALLSYEFWILNNPIFNEIKICSDNKQILISKICLEKYTLESIFSQIKNTLQANPDFKRNIWINSNNLIPENYIALNSRVEKKVKSPITPPNEKEQEGEVIHLYQETKPASLPHNARSFAELRQRQNFSDDDSAVQLPQNKGSDLNKLSNR